MSDERHGFELLQDEAIAELNSRARLYRHRRTGAELLSVQNEDENKVFGITFRTPPDDSTGLPHILEHSVLCGSRKYPVKEPFVELIKGSLNTFLNAFTYPDKTCYPVASTNLQDFYNLIDVYLDAVFYPRLTAQVLQQEGWHYEVEDSEQPLSYKGVVFNEMKGAYGSPEALLYKTVQEALYPDTTYGVDSGGDPTHIPDLTWEKFKAFHETLYHPSNARIFFYGDDEPTERLRLLDEWLRDFDRAEVQSEVALQPPFEAPRAVERAYPVSEGEAEGDGERRGRVVLAWLLPEPMDVERALALDILSHLLIGTSASPLRKSLIESGLGEDLAGYGLNGELRQMNFSVGLKGINPAAAPQVEALVLATLRELADGAIDQATVEAAMNSVEFVLREQNSGSYPRGLLLMLRALSTWLYGGDPIAPLAFEEPLAAIKQRLASGDPLFETLIQQHLLDNPHRVTVLLRPDAALADEMEAAERRRLDEARAAMVPDEVARLVEESRLLREAQQRPDDPAALALIPSLKLADLERESKTIPTDERRVAGVRVLAHELVTNGILYLDLGFDLHGLPGALLPYGGLFGRALLELGTQQEDFVRLQQRINRKTGGIRAETLTTTVQGQEQGAAWLFLRGKATVEQADELLAILADVLRDVALDNQARFRQIVLEEKAGLEAALLPWGHRIVARRMRALFTEADWADEQLTGVDQLFFLRALAQEVEDDWPAVLARLEEVRSRLISRPAMLANVTVDSEAWQTLEPRLHDFLAALPDEARDVQSWERTLRAPFEGLAIPGRVNYVGKAADLRALGHEPDGRSIVVSRFLRTSWMWERVRVQGGAYGAFSMLNSRSGLFTYVSYRDPNMLDTLDVYDQSGRFLREVPLDQEEIVKNIVGTIGDLDGYQLPDAKGWIALERCLAGISDGDRQRQRDEVLGTNEGDFRAFADVLDRVAEVGRVVIMGSQSALEAADERLDRLELVKLL